jgi:hypothetical protein
MAGGAAKRHVLETPDALEEQGEGHSSLLVQTNVSGGARKAPHEIADQEQGGRSDRRLSPCLREVLAARQT